MELTKTIELFEVQIEINFKVRKDTDQINEPEDYRIIDIWVLDSEITWKLKSKLKREMALDLKDLENGSKEQGKTIEEVISDYLHDELYKEIEEDLYNN